MHSVAGAFDPGDGLLRRPPFEDPHHTATPASVVGGGSGVPRPGAASRAHRGVLFLDEAPEFSTAVLQTLRQPLEHGELVLHRAAGHGPLPGAVPARARGQPVPVRPGGRQGARRARAAASSDAGTSASCPGRCSTGWTCRSSSSPARAGAGAGESSAVGRRAGARRARRAGGSGSRARRGAPTATSRAAGCGSGSGPDRSLVADLDRALDRGTLSLRGVDRVLRVAWTLADLAGRAAPGRADVGHALLLRTRGQRRVSGDDGAEVLARATWSALVEPGDVVAGALVGLLGAVGRARRGSARPSRARGPTSALPRGPGAARSPTPTRRRVARAVARWAVRLPDCDPRRDLGAPRPARRRAAGAGRPAVAVGARRPRRRGAVLPVGPRRRRTCGAALGAVRRGRRVAGGDDLRRAGRVRPRRRAHRGRRVRGLGRCVRHRRGGAPRGRRARRPRPSSCSRVVSTGRTRRGTRGCSRPSSAAGGALVSEVPPGSLPTKSRFLQRNRLIAAAGRATVVVEAAWRSGAMSTAHHAARLLRPVGAVPGPVTSMASAGCHRLLREGVAVCVTDAAEVRELAGIIGSGPGRGRRRPARGRRSRGSAAGRARPACRARVLDALPRRVPAELDRVASRRRRHGRRGAGRAGAPGARRVGGPPRRRVGRCEVVRTMTAAAVQKARRKRSRMRGGEEIRG